MLSGGAFWSIMSQVSKGRLRPNGTVEKTKTGAILYDRAVLNHISSGSFTPEAWQWSQPVSGALHSAGRGATMYVGDGDNEFVLRHYRRGGLLGRVNRDLYWWLSEERTRSFSEWRLLSWLHSKGLPVPRPAAARYSRVGGLLYRADLQKWTPRGHGREPGRLGQAAQRARRDPVAGRPPPRAARRQRVLAVAWGSYPALPRRRRLSCRSQCLQHPGERSRRSLPAGLRPWPAPAAGSLAGA